MKKSGSTEIIVGIVVLAGFVTIVGLTISIRGSLFGGSMKLKIGYSQVSGLETGSAVLVRGVRQGRVATLEATPENKKNPVTVIAEMERGAVIYANAKARIVQMGFIGDKRVEIDPGDPSAPLLTTGSYIEGTVPFDMEQTFRKLDTIVTDIQGSVEAVHKFVSNDDTMQSIRDAIKSLNSTSTRIDAVLAKNEAAITDTVENLKKVSGKAIDVSDKADKLLADASNDVRSIGDESRKSIASIREQANQIGEKVTRLVDKLDERTGTVTSAIQSDLNETSAEFKRLSENLRQTSATLNKVLTKIEEGKGTIGMLVNDPIPFQDLRATMLAIRNTFMGRPTQLYDSSLPYAKAPRKADVTP